MVMNLQTRTSLNLKVLRRHDPTITAIVETTSHCVVYDFNAATSSWTKKGAEGTMFLVQRGRNDHGIFVLNRVATENYLATLTSDMEVQMLGDYVIFRLPDDSIIGLWLYETADRNRITSTMQLLTAQTRDGVPDGGQSSIHNHHHHHQPPDPQLNVTQNINNLAYAPQQLPLLQNQQQPLLPVPPANVVSGVNPMNAIFPMQQPSAPQAMGYPSMQQPQLHAVPGIQPVVPIGMYPQQPLQPLPQQQPQQPQQQQQQNMSIMDLFARASVAAAPASAPPPSVVHNVVTPNGTVHSHGPLPQIPQNRVSSLADVWNWVDSLNPAGTLTAPRALPEIEFRSRLAYLLQNPNFQQALYASYVANSG